MVKATEAQAFPERGAAEAALTQLLPSWSGLYHHLQGEVEQYEQTLPYPRRGRPRAGAVRPTATCYRLQVALVPDAAAQQRARERCGLFVLLTSLVDRAQYPACHLLDTSKGQHTAEQALRFIKSPAWVGAYCLKKPERMAALGYVVLLEAIVYTLLERQVHRALAQPGQPPVRGLNSQPTQRPTAYAIQVLLSSILVLQEVVEGRPRFRLNRPLSENQRWVLQLAGFSETIYHLAGPAEKFTCSRQLT